MMYKRNGAIRFVRIGRICATWCIARPKRSERPVWLQELGLVVGAVLLIGLLGLVMTAPMLLQGAVLR